MRFRHTESIGGKSRETPSSRQAFELVNTAGFTLQKRKQREQVPLFSSEGSLGLLGGFSSDGCIFLDQFLLGDVFDLFGGGFLSFFNHRLFSNYSGSWSSGSRRGSSWSNCSWSSGSRLGSSWSSGSRRGSVGGKDGQRRNEGDEQLVHG